MKWHKKLLVLVACLCSFCVCGLFGTKNANAASITNILNDQLTYRLSRSGNTQTVNHSGAVPLMIIYDTGSHSYYSFVANAFSTSSPLGTQSGLSYIIDVQYTINFDGINVATDLIANPQLIKGSVRFEQGNISSENQSVSIVRISATSITIKHHSEVTLVNTASLSSIVVATSLSNGGSIAYCDSGVQAMALPCSASGQYAQLRDVTMTAIVSQDPSIVLQQQMINQNQTIINQNQQQIDQDNQDRDGIEQTSEDAEQAGESASENANATGQTLMQAFTSLITALTNIHQTNCNLPNFSLYGLNFNNMNMCMFDVPDGLMNLASIGMVFIIVPLGINLVKRMIALYNEIVGGGK